MDKFVNTTLLLGGNQGNTKQLLCEVVEKTGQNIGKVVNESSLYETEPWGFEASQKFINQAIVVQTSLSAEQVLESALFIEKELGRVRHVNGYASRTMDIDIIFYGDCCISTPNLIVPHPRMHERNFVLVPLAEIMPNFVHPILKKTILQLLHECKDIGKVWKLRESSKESIL